MNILRKTILAIEKFKMHIVKFPIYFQVKDLEYLETQKALDNIAEKLESSNYQPNYVQSYLIPYDTISTRKGYSLHIDDLIIRYVLFNHLESTLKLYSNKINPSEFNIFCIVDIFDCYNQINNDILIQTLRQELASKIDNDSFILLERCLTIYENSSDKISGLLVGSKPDEYFAELFLSVLHSKMNTGISDNISRSGDEFLIFADSIGEIRGIVSGIISLLNDKGLTLNKSKNKTVFVSEKRKLTRLIPFEEPWLYNSPSCPPPDFPNILYNEVNFTISHKGKQDNGEILKINTYEDSIKYLNSIAPEIEKIELFINTYPEYSLFGYWNSSTPTETKKLHQEIDFKKILNPKILDNLETIIYRFPRSQYFSGMAIKYLCTYAINFNYNIKYSCKHSKTDVFLVENYDFTAISEEISSLICEKSNSILLNAIRSNDIYDYQKYLIIRELFFDKQNLTIKEKNYKIKGDAPFPILFKNEIKKLADDYIDEPLRNIISEILTFK